MPSFTLLPPAIILEYQKNLKIVKGADEVKGSLPRPYCLFLFFLEFAPVDNLVSDNLAITRLFVLSDFIQKAFFNEGRHEGPVHLIEIDPVLGEDIDPDHLIFPFEYGFEADDVETSNIIAER